MHGFFPYRIIRYDKNLKKCCGKLPQYDFEEEQRNNFPFFYQGLSVDYYLFFGIKT